MSMNALAIDLFAATGRAGDRRLAGRALAHWDALRGMRELPSLEDYAPAFLPFAQSSTFVIEIHPREDLDEIVQAGDALAAALGLDAVGRHPLEVLPSATHQGMSFYRTSAELRKPIADVGEFVNSRGKAIQYRCILLPLSRDQATVDHVLGAFSFRTGV